MIPKGINIIAQRRNDSKTSDDNPVHLVHRLSSFIRLGV
jgi:hypothetical protein